MSRFALYSDEEGVEWIRDVEAESADEALKNNADAKSAQLVREE